MSEPLFQRHARGLTLAEIAALTGAPPPAAPALGRRIVDVAPLSRASPSAVSFLDHNKYATAAGATHAGACFTTEVLARHLPAAVPALVVPEPFRAFVMVARELFPHALRPSSLAEAGQTAGAHVHPTARLESGATIEPGAVIGPRAEIGSGTVIGANAVIGADVRIGRNCSIGAGAVITDTLVGDGVIIHPGCKIGQDGFGFVMGAGGHLKIPQVARVIIQDDVEIGSGTTIDRGAIRDTVIGEGTKIDNLVQVGHNVSIGRHCVLVSQVGIAGSATLEDFVVLAGRVAVKNDVTIGEGAQIAAVSNVNGPVPAGARWGGSPAKPMAQWFREIMTIERMARGRRSAAADK
ncbi:MAG TPA: UDP-3-O-(3-hydroxymyristoyl)glucosamine N-acyltransferase [Pseudolabrys sp.]|nr:UDP-3-O-(3-hydroxymyristoyl)glucosamine N-acyltransferase [Pseudolabrys sp.]